MKTFRNLPSVPHFDVIRSLFFAVVARRTAVTAFAAIVFGLAASPAHAATKIWINTAGGSWDSPGNWNPSLVPGAGDNVVITNAGAYTVVIANGAKFGTLTVGGGGDVNAKTIS